MSAPGPAIEIAGSRVTRGGRLVVPGLDLRVPAGHVVDAAKVVAVSPGPAGDLGRPVLVIAVWTVVALVLGSLTLRRRTA